MYGKSPESAQRGSESNPGFKFTELKACPVYRW